ncbi:MAG: septal ring lytic transglycosylase RlpA family protein [Candidatus Manganitrophus sp.]|nr:MAG: septal ring lytic transglycosylase RlpA family protein [Candidatus Manganitrophus sp.]
MSLMIHTKRFFPTSFPRSLSIHLVIWVGLLAFSGCAGSPRKADYDLGYRETGRASWYGKDFHGRPTSSGEIYNMFELSAAHQTLPFGTHLRVTKLDSGRSVRVKVTDRGPFVDDRILDLSYEAARKLGMIQEGTADVEIEIIGFEKMHGHGDFFIQVGSFQSKENAARIKEKLGGEGQTVRMETIETGDGPSHRVRVGPFRSEKAARAAVGRLQRQLASESLKPIILRE